MPPQRRFNTPDAQTLARFFDDAARVLGEENVSRTPEHGALRGAQNRDSYSDPFSFSTLHQPSGAVRPGDVEDVQELLKLANRHKVPLWTVSRGKNLGYILEVNGEYGYAIVEPGVSFFDLYEEIQRRGLGLWPSVPAIGWGSHSQSQCGMEVVLPKGDILRTGMGAMAENNTFALYKGRISVSPGLDWKYYDQRLLIETGVVTKIGIHITPAPEAYATFTVSVSREEDLVPLVGVLSDLMRRSVILNSPSIANIFRIALLSQAPEVQAKLAQHMKPNSHVPYLVLEEIRRQQGWGFWKAYFSLHGSMEMLPALLSTVQRAFSVIPGVQIQWREFPGNPGRTINAAEIGSEEIPHSGISTLSPLDLINSRAEPDGGHIDYSPILPPSGRELYHWYLTAKRRTVDANFDFFADFHVYPRYVVAIELTLARDGAEQGYIAYRTHVSHMDNLAGGLDFNGHAFSKVTSVLKDLFDPNGILSPGKSGICNALAIYVCIPVPFYS
ncbi:hypothetical protein BDW72DRAFT_212813 [Aspergillus terricola var. indicus]